MQDQGAELKFFQAARIFTLANLGKYAPGRVWSIVGAGALARDYQISSWAAATVTLVLQILTLATGMLVAGVFARKELETLWPVAPLLTLALGALVLGLAFGLSIPKLRKGLEGVAHAFASRIPQIRSSTFFFVNFLSILAWMGFGASLLLMERAMFGSFSISWQSAVGTFAASYVLGFVALLAPAGLGPREAALVVLLSSSTNALHAAALALVSRVLITICDLLFAVPFLRGKLGGPDRSQSSQLPTAPTSTT